MLPCGLANAPSPFRRVMNGMLASNPGLHMFFAIYFDDVLIHNVTRAEHLNRVRIVLDLVQTAGLNLKTSKCKRFCNEIKFCILQIKQELVRTLGSMTWAVSKWPRPQNTKELHGFTCPIGYHHKFIQHYAQIWYSLAVQSDVHNEEES